MNVAAASNRSCSAAPTVVREKRTGGPGVHSAGDKASPRGGLKTFGGGKARVCQPAGRSSG
eukprot:12914508-Prorocentrum_lima.AAC.1